MIVNLQLSHEWKTGEEKNSLHSDPKLDLPSTVISR